MINRVTLMGRIRGDVRISGVGADLMVTFMLTTGRRWVDPQTGKARLLTEQHTVVSHRTDIIDRLRDMDPADGATVYAEGALRADATGGTDRLTVVIEDEGQLRVVRMPMHGDDGPQETLDMTDLADG